MAVTNDLVATVVSRQLNLYAIRDGTILALSSLPLLRDIPPPEPDIVLTDLDVIPADSDIVFVSPSACLKMDNDTSHPCHMSIHIMVTICDQYSLVTHRFHGSDDNFELVHTCIVFRSRYPDDFLHTRPSRPQLGVNGRTVSWITFPTLYPEVNILHEDPYAYFCTTSIARNDGIPEHENSIIQFREPDMPALYTMAVRSYDDTRGFLAVGNMYGELAVYDFSRSNFAGLPIGFCTSVTFPIVTDEQLLPTV